MQESQNTARVEKSPDGSREKTIRKVTWVGLFTNVLLAGFKFFCRHYRKQPGAGGRCHPQPYGFDNRYCRNCGLSLLVPTTG